MNDPVSPERRAAGQKLRAYLLQKKIKQVDFGRELEGATEVKDGRQNVAKWCTGRGFGNSQRAQCESALGLQTGYFGRESDGDPRPAVAQSPARWPTLKRWLKEHPEADQRLVRALVAVDHALESDPGEPIIALLVAAHAGAAQIAKVRGDIDAGRRPPAKHPKPAKKHTRA